MLLRQLLGFFVYIFLKIWNISCENGSTLAFAIDDTRSMWDDIDQVKNEAHNIMKVVLTEKSSEIKDFVLVTINDPDVVLQTKTNSTHTFQMYLNNIRVHNFANIDCAEMSMTGIEKALLASRPESYVYVFTDATAKDYYKASYIKSLCQKKQSQVVFVLTGDCGDPSSQMFTVYHEIAAACGGQVFHVRKDQVDSVLQTIKILLKGKNPAIKWIMVPKSFTFVPVPFTIDEKVDYAMVSTSGKDVVLRISTVNQSLGPEPHIETIMWNENGKVVRLVDPLPGTYYAWVRGNSAVSVVIYARTDFTFEHGFSTLKPKSMKDTAKQPIAGTKQHLSIKVSDPEHSVNIELAQILDLNNDDFVIMELPLRKTDENFYITDPFISPSHMFKIAIKGKAKRTCRLIRRISKTAVEPAIPIVVIPEIVPNVKIDEGINFDVNYGTDVTLTCRVSAHPAPNIEWFKSSKGLLLSESSLIEDTSYISYLKLKNIKQDGTYVCKASNKRGTMESQIHVGVRPVFKQLPTAATISAKYQEEVKIPCAIKSYLPIRVKWFLLGKELSNSRMYSISEDGFELTVKSMDLGMEGKYTCEVSLNSDHTVKQSHSIDVKIGGLARPVIKPSNKKIYLIKRDKLELICNAVKGYPKPHIQWFKKNGDQYNPLRVIGEKLTVPSALFIHAGKYKCIAENIIGSDSAEFEVAMRSLPEITMGEVERHFSYGSDVVLTCKVESQFPVTIVWTDGKGRVLQNKVTQTSEYEFVNQLKLQNVNRTEEYICLANHTLGSNAEHVNITVPSVFEVKGHIEGDIEINYGFEKSLFCDIKATRPMKIQWYRQAIGVESSRSLINSSDKYIISGDGSELKIKYMDVYTDGEYTCEASLLYDPENRVSFSANVKIVGLSGPEITYSTTVLYKQNFSAICRVKGVPKPTISWQFKPNGSKVFTTIPGSGEELNIPELKLKHSGGYKCVVKNHLGETHHDFDVIAKEPPTITNDRTTYFGVEGDLVMKIPCNVTGFPEPEIIWKMEGQDIEKSDSKYVIKGNDLYIKSPMMSDSKNFSCEARNELGVSWMNFETEVVDFFQHDEDFYGDTHEIYIEQGKPVAIECKIINSETRSVRWYRNGEKTNQTGNAYVIEKASVSDDGNYTCRVDTNEGSIPENYLLDVGFPPAFYDDSSSLIDVSWVDDEILDCKAPSKPEARFEWLHNGKKMKKQNGETIHVSDWGEYTCRVSNVHGSIQKTFNITTPGCYLTKNMGTQNKPLISDIESQIWPFLMSNSDVLLKENEEIKLSCPNNKDSLNAFQMIPSKTEITAKCSAQDQFVVDGKTYRYSELQCKKKVEPLVTNKHELCLGPNSEMIRVGFELDKFLNIYEICFDKKLHVPLYGSAPISLATAKNEAHPSEFKWSPALEVSDGKPTGGYTCEMSNTCCYAKNQLVNYNELPFGPAQDAMFKENLNSIAVWIPCAGSGRTSWQKFENEIRDLSEIYSTWSSWTGASDYIPKNGGLVPRYLWKLMRYEGSSSVMVYVNDEFPVPSDVRCTKTCTSFVESSDKYLYCCTVEEFGRAFGISTDKLV